LNPRRNFITAVQAMNLELPNPIESPEQLRAHLAAALPQYSVTSRGGVPIVGMGSVTGVIVKPVGPKTVKLIWGYPSMVAQVLLMLGTVATGILPGLIVIGIMWLVIKGDVARIDQDIATALTSGAPPPSTATTRTSSFVPPKPGASLLIAASACAWFALRSGSDALRYLESGSLEPIFAVPALCWLGLASASAMVYSAERSAHAAHLQSGGTAAPRPPGKGALLGAVSALGLALVGALVIVRYASGLSGSGGPLGPLTWLLIAIALFMAHGRNAQSDGAPAAPNAAMVPLGLVFLWFSYRSIAPILGMGIPDDMGAYEPGPMKLSALAWMLLAIAVFMRFAERKRAAAGSAPSAAPSAAVATTAPPIASPAMPAPVFAPAAVPSPAPTHPAPTHPAPTHPAPTNQPWAGYPPGTPILVSPGDGQRYPSVVLAAANGHYQCTMPNGQTYWFPAHQVATH